MRHAAVQNVADDRDARAVERAELFDQRVDVEQRLRRMRVRAVAGVDDVAVERNGDPLGKARFPVPHDETRKAHRAERDGGVLERFAFVARLRFSGEVDDVGAQAQFGEVERRERPRALLEEHVGARPCPASSGPGAARSNCAVRSKM